MKRMSASWIGLLALLFAPPLLQAAEVPAADVDGYRRRVAPLLMQYCADCHGPDDPAAQLSLASIRPDLMRGGDLETWRMISEQIRFGDMPPPDAEPLPTRARTELVEWIRQELHKTQLPGVITEEKLLLPQFGNYVDHEQLFDHRQARVTPAPPRIWRLRPEIYNTLVPQLGNRIHGLSSALHSLGGPEFRDFSAPYFLDEASTQQLLANAKQVAKNLLSPQSNDKRLRALVQEDGLPPQKIVAEAIETTFRKALARGPTPEERRRFFKLYREAQSIGGNASAATALISAVLLQPEFLFRQELGDGHPDEHGRVRLTPRELGYALSYALADQPLDLFPAEQRISHEQLTAILQERLHDDSKLQDKNPRLLQFFREYLHYPFATEVFKDMPAGGKHDAARLVRDLETTIRDILREDQHVLGELLTTRRFYVNANYKPIKRKGVQLVKAHPKRSAYHTAYSLPLDWKWSAHLQPVSFPEAERAGVLTHPAWLAAWSGNFDNHPVQRGKWIRTHLLGGTVPDVPIGVDARVPEQEHTTFRDRLAQATHKAECWRCHRKMDPLGVPFERYDHYGRFQRLDAGRPVNVTGKIARTPFPELHGPVSGPTEMMERLAKSERVEQVFVRHVFRYFLGRNETLGDANTLQDAHDAYRESGGSFRQLVVSLLTSDSFLLRQLERPPEAQP